MHVPISSVSGGGTEGALLRVTAASLCLTLCSPSGSTRPPRSLSTAPSWQIENSHQGAEHLNFAGEMHSCDTWFWMGLQPALHTCSHQSWWSERVLSTHVTCIARVIGVCRNPTLPSVSPICPVHRVISFSKGEVASLPLPTVLLSFLKLEPYKMLSLCKKRRPFFANLGSKVFCSLLMLLFFLQQHRMWSEMCLCFKTTKVPVIWLTEAVFIWLRVGKKWFFFFLLWSS